MVSTDDDSTSKEDMTPNPPTEKKKKKVTAKKGKSTTAKKKRRHKPKDFPKRPLSAYNIFFKETREAILTENEGKSEIAFQTMAKEIASRWKNLNPEDKERVNSLAEKDMKRYREEVKTYEEEMVKRSRKEREEAENLRRIQAAEKAEEEAASNAAASAALANGPAAVNSMSALGAAGQSGLNSASLEQHFSNGGGMDFDAMRREQIQMKLLEELRSIEARAMQIRQLQAQLGLPTESYSSNGFGGGNGTQGGMGGAPGGAPGGFGGASNGFGGAGAGAPSGGATDFLGRQANPVMSSLAAARGEPSMNEYELLLRQRAAASLAPGPAGLSGMGGMSGLLGLTGAAGLGLGRLGGAGLGGGGGLGGAGGQSGLGGGGGLNMGLLAQLQGLQQALGGMGREAGGAPGPGAGFPADLHALLQQQQAQAQAQGGSQH